MLSFHDTDNCEIVFEITGGRHVSSPYEAMEVARKLVQVAEECASKIHKKLMDELNKSHPLSDVRQEDLPQTDEPNKLYWVRKRIGCPGHEIKDYKPSGEGWVLVEEVDD